MTEDKDQRIFFVDDELVERLMRGDVIAEPPKKRPADSSVLAQAPKLPSGGRLDEAVTELQRALDRGENPVEIHAGMGHLRFQQEQWSEAAACYGKAAELDPQHSTAHYNLGLCLEREGKFDDAARAFETALSVDPKRWQAQLSRGLCLLHLGMAAPALECFEDCLKAHPRQDRAVFGKAVALHRLGRLEEAAELYRKLLPGNAGSPELLVNLISLSMARNDAAGTKEFAERLLKIRPTSVPALQALAGAALSCGDYGAAAQHGSQLVTVSADCYQGWFNLGVAYQNTGLLEQAGNAYREALRLRPDSVEANLNLGVVLQERGDPAGARRLYERALASLPDTPGALWNLALLTERDGAIDQAEKYFEKLVALKPDFEDAAFRLGILQMQRGEFAGAVDCFELCLKQRGDWVEALLNLGLAGWKFEDLDAAVDAFTRVLALRPDHPDALRALTAVAIERKDHKRAWELHRKLAVRGEQSAELSYNLGLLLQSADQNQFAAECYRMALEKKPGFPEALLNLGHALKAAGKDDEARRVWSQAVAADAGLADKYFH